VGGRQHLRGPTGSWGGLALLLVAALAAIAFAAPARADENLQTSSTPPLRIDRSAALVVAEVDAPAVPDVTVPASATAAAPESVTTENPANEVSSVDDAVSPAEATTQSGAISLPVVVQVHVRRASSNPGLSRRTPGQYHSVTPQYQPPPERRATVDHAARSETEPPVSPPAPDSPEETNGESAGSGSNYGTNCADLSADTAPICSEGGAHNSDWNCEWIAYCSTEIPPVETVPAVPECAVPTPSAGQYQPADGQYQSDPACEPAPAETGCAAAGAVTPAVSAPDSTAEPVPADLPPTQPQPAEQPTTAPPVARPHGGTDGRAESPLTAARQDAGGDTEGWSQVSTSRTAADPPTAPASASAPAAVIRAEPVPRRDASNRAEPSPITSVEPRQFRLALAAPPLGNLAKVPVSSRGAAGRIDAWLLVFAVLLAGAAALGLSAAGSLTVWVPAVALELSARLRSKGFSRRAGTIGAASKDESADAIRYRD
jgi:DNA segregation ATPase FtsK/SpoIIIE, S-DNA-T family